MTAGKPTHDDVYDRQIRLWGAEAQVNVKNYCYAPNFEDRSRGHPPWVLGSEIGYQICSSTLIRRLFALAPVHRAETHVQRSGSLCPSDGRHLRGHEEPRLGGGAHRQP